MTIAPKPKQNQLALGPPDHTWCQNPFYRGVPRASEEKSGDPGHPNKVLGREGSRRESVGSSGALCLMRSKRLNGGVWEERGPRKTNTM